MLLVVAISTATERKNAMQDISRINCQLYDKIRFNVFYEKLNHVLM